MTDSHEGDKGTPDQPGVEGWDRIGEFMGRANETGQTIAKRHLKVWNEISASLRDPSYGADDWARNTARVAASVFDDAQDVVGLLTSVRERRPVSGEIPTVFLFVEAERYGGEGEDSRPDIQWIAIPSSIKSPPPDAEVALSGGPSADAAEAVRRTITAERDPGDEAKYLVRCNGPDPHAGPLEFGSYFGLIYVRDERAEIPLADLRVVVRSRSED